MALKFLLATLLVSPLARYAKQPLLIRTRRLLGLWCFAWATLHLTSYTLLELGIQQSGAAGLGVSQQTLPDFGFYQLVDFAGAGRHLNTSAAEKTGSPMANFAQLRLSGGNPCPHSTYLWSVKILSPQPVIYAVLAALLLAWRYKKFRQWWR